MQRRNHGVFRGVEGDMRTDRGVENGRRIASAGGLAALGLLVLVSGACTSAADGESTASADRAASADDAAISASPVPTEPGGEDQSPEEGEYYGLVRAVDVIEPATGPGGTLTVRVACADARTFGADTTFFFDTYEPARPRPTFFDLTGPQITAVAVDQRWDEELFGYEATLRLDALVPPGGATLRVSCDELGGGFPVPITVPDYSGVSWYAVEPLDWDLSLGPETDPRLGGAVRVGHPIEVSATCPGEAADDGISLVAFRPDAVDRSRPGRLHQGTPVSTTTPSSIQRTADGSVAAMWSIDAPEAWLGEVALQITCAALTAEGIAAAYYGTDTFHYDLAVAEAL